MQAAPVPILLLSDCPSQTSGLARVTRDLATLLSSMPEFRVATLGLQGSGSRYLPFTTYHMFPGEFGEASLPMVWDEWSGGEAGIVMVVWDASRVLWLARPEFCEDQTTREWLIDARRRKFKLWLYSPFDSTGPGNRLTTLVREVLLGVDRVLVPSPWALGIVRNTIGQVEAEKRGADWLPHMLNTRTFAPSPISIDASDASHVTRIGVVATNQTRKDWGCVATVCAALTERLKGNVCFWWHCDTDMRHWNLHALISDFQLGEYVELTSPPVTDAWLVEQYRQCDLTFLPSSEGFGYPLFESLACGVPVVHGDYAGGGSLMSAFGLNHLLVRPYTWRLEGVHNCIRPVYRPEDFVDRIMELLESGHPLRSELLRGSVEHLSSMKLGVTWKRWLKEGL